MTISPDLAAHPQFFNDCAQPGLELDSFGWLLGDHLVLKPTYQPRQEKITTVKSGYGATPATLSTEISSCKIVPFRNAQDAVVYA